MLRRWTRMFPSRISFHPPYLAECTISKLKFIPVLPCLRYLDNSELMRAFPEAKVILTVRDDPETWHKSVLNSIFEGNVGELL